MTSIMVFGGRIDANLGKMKVVRHGKNTCCRSAVQTWSHGELAIANALPQLHLPLLADPP